MIIEMIGKQEHDARLILLHERGKIETWEGGRFEDREDEQCMELGRSVRALVGVSGINARACGY
jgi:hypothetical protein